MHESAPIKEPIPAADAIYARINAGDFKSAIFLAREYTYALPAHPALLTAAGTAYERCAENCNITGDFLEVPYLLIEAEGFYERALHAAVGKVRCPLETRMRHVATLKALSKNEISLKNYARENPEDSNAYIYYIGNLCLQSKFEKALAELENRLGDGSNAKAIDILIALAGSNIISVPNVSESSRQHARALAQAATNRVMASGWLGDADYFLACLQHRGLKVGRHTGTYNNVGNNYSMVCSALSVARQRLSISANSLADGPEDLGLVF